MKPLVVAVGAFGFGAVIGAYVVGNLVHRRQSTLIAFEYLAISERLKAKQVDEASGIADGNLLQLLPVIHNTANSAWRHFIPSSTGVTGHTIRKFRAYPPVRLSETPPFANSYPEMDTANVSEIKNWYKERLENEQVALGILAEEQKK